MFENFKKYAHFTDRARKVMPLANQEAQRFNHEYIATEHILLGLIKEGSGLAAVVLKSLGVRFDKVRFEVEKIIPIGPHRVTIKKLPITPRAKKVIDYAIEESENLHHNYVGTEHLLLGLLREEEGVAVQVLLNLGLKLEDIRREIIHFLGHDTEIPSKKPSTVDERIRSLERQLWNLRVLLGGAAGAIAGALFSSSKGVMAEGLILGGIAAGLGGRIPCVLIGGFTGAMAASVQWGDDGGSVAGALLGALIGFLLAEIGGSSDHRESSLRGWRK